MMKNKDIDKEIVLRLNDKDFIKMCFLNKYMYNMYKEDKYLLFKRRLEKYYPNTVRLRYNYGNWREYYLLVMRTIRQLKETCKFDYKFGNPFKQEIILKNIRNFEDNRRYTTIFYYAIKQNELALVKYAIEEGHSIISKYDILDAASLEDTSILKYLIEKGANLTFFDLHYWDRISEPSRELLRNFIFIPHS